MSIIFRTDQHAGITFPSMRYHRHHEPKIVHTPEQDSELGDEWADTPAAFAADASAEAADEVEPANDEEPEAVVADKPRRGRPPGAKNKAHE
jgi:hypothetical protein